MLRNAASITLGSLVESAAPCANGGFAKSLRVSFRPVPQRPPETIRYYEREGIISKAGRTASGRRVYSEAEISELRFIKRCRDLGFSIHDAVSLRRISTGSADACEAAEHLGREHLSEVQKKIRELKCLERALSELIFELRVRTSGLSTSGSTWGRRHPIWQAGPHGLIRPSSDLSPWKLLLFSLY